MDADGGGFFKHRIRLPKALKPALGGLCVGLIGIFYPQVYGYSYDPILHAISGDFAITTLLALVAVKTIATSSTLGSGGSGRILCPSLFLGAMTGSACGGTFKHLFPQIVSDPGGYGVVGMGAMLGAAIQAPMTAIIMIFELTNVYTVILPMMTACITATLVHKSILKGSIYTLSLARRGIDIDAGREMGILSGLHVREIMETKVTSIRCNTPYGAIIGQCLRGGCSYLYVTDEMGSLEGVISFSDLKEFIFEEGLHNLVLAKDLCNRNIVSVTPNDSLASALNEFSLVDIEQLPVVERSNGFLLMKGTVSRSHLLNAYRQELLKHSLIGDRTKKRVTQQFQESP